MKTITAFLCAMMISGVCLAGEHEDAARLLIQTTGEAERAAQSLKQYLLASLKAKPDGILKQATVDAVKTLKATDFENVLIPIYVKHFTQEELAELTSFAKTPVGQKSFRKQEVLFQEGRQATMDLGKQIALRAAKRAIEEHGEDAIKQEMKEGKTSNKTTGGDVQ